MDLIMDDEKLVKINNNNKLLNNNNPVFKAKDELGGGGGIIARPESENSLVIDDGQAPVSPISLSPTVSETIYEFGSHFENSNQVISEKVKNLASQIYNELQKVMVRCNDDEETVGGLMSLIVTVLENLDLALIENQQLQVELELCKDDNEQLVNVFEKEKQSKKKVEQKLFEFEFTTEEEKQQYQQRIDSLANIVKMLELKSKNASDHSTRLEEKESELRKEYNKLHERNTELLRSHCDLMERFKIMFGADADPTSNNIVQLTNLFKQNLQRLSADGEEVAFTDRLTVYPREATESSTQQAQKESALMKNATMDNCWTMEQEMSYDDTTTICEDVEELQRDKDKEHSLSGMEKEIENLITENNELLATKNALNIVKDDLIAKVDELQSELVMCSNEIQQRDAVQERLKSRIAQMEEELKKHKEELEQTKQKLASMNEDDEEGVSMAQRKRFTRVEMSRVLMERNNYKEKYFELQDALRSSEMNRANRIEDKRSGIWKFFSNFFGPSGNGTLEGGDVGRGAGRGSSNATIRYSANPTVTPALEAMRRRARAQQNSDLVLMMDSDLTSERTRAMKNVRAHVTRTTSGDRVQAYGWSIPGSTNNTNNDPKTSLSLKSASVPVPIYCRPLGGEDIGMKIWCATAVDLTGGEAGFPISDTESIDSDKKDSNGKKDSLEELETEINEALKERKEEFINDQNLSTYVWICSVSHSKSKVTIVNIRSNPGEVLDSFFIRTHLLCTATVPGAKTNDLLGSSGVVVDETVPELKLKEASKRSSIVHSNTEPNLQSVSSDIQSSSERRVHFADENKSSSKSSSKEDIDLEVAKSVSSASVPIGEPNSLPARSVTLEKLTEYVAYKSPPSPTNLTSSDGDNSKQQVTRTPSAASSLPIQAMSTRLPTMWLGGQNGVLYVHSGIAQWSHCIATIHLSDSILQIVHYRGRVFVALANGQCCIFVRSESTGEWDFDHYYVLDIGIHNAIQNNSSSTSNPAEAGNSTGSPSNSQQQQGKTAQFSIRCLEVSKDTVWLGYRNLIFIIGSYALLTLSSEEGTNGGTEREALLGADSSSASSTSSLQNYNRPEAQAGGGGSSTSFVSRLNQRKTASTNRRIPEQSGFGPSRLSSYNADDYDRRRRQRRRSFVNTFLCCFCMAFSQCFRALFTLVWRKKDLKPRNVPLQSQGDNDRNYGGGGGANEYPPNIVRNQKYNIFTFLPIVLFNQFKFFLNLYFLSMACSQFIDSLKVGPIFTYWAPLGFVLGVTLIREAVDDILRYKRDKAVNSQFYTKLTPHGLLKIPSANIKVGDMIQINKNERVPADMIFLRTSERNGACFIRTDQLDGETDWKLRLAVTTTQELECDEALFELDASIHAEEPRRDIHQFMGKFENALGKEIPLNIENTLWANTVVASGTAIGIVIYTGPETRSMMNNNEPRSKVGLLDYEVNQLTKLLFVAVVVLALAMICLKGFSGFWYIYWFRYVLLFSYIIPISLRVNLEMGRVAYCQMIQRDTEIAGTLARTTTIPEDLGRISYLLTDKTGTLTKNEMVFKRIHCGRISYSHEYFEEVSAILRAYYNPNQIRHDNNSASGSGGQVSNFQTHRRESSTASASSITFERKTHMRVDSYEVDREVIYRVQQSVLAIALCHNVTPAYENQFEGDGKVEQLIDIEQDPASVFIPMQNVAIQYHASSPDEVALVQWTEKVGLALIFRDIKSIRLRNPYGQAMDFEILDIFPFSSETKRMGIIVRDMNTKEIVFYLKGADTVMSSITTYSDWLQEQCDNMARNGLRTLVVAKKILDEDQYLDFQERYNQAKCNMNDRAVRVRAVLATLEKDMELLCLTGVEDRLQDQVATTLKGLQDAGIKLWMLTGDKLETAISIAKSSQLVKKMQQFYVFSPVKNRTEVHNELNAFGRKSDGPLIIRGEDLELCMKYYSAEFIDMATQCPAVVCCRCSPTQKAEVVKMIQQRTGKRTCAVGDGGNDVSMIQTANVGIGIVGKEGQQASLAADFSILQFSNIYRLILLHGRYSYKRSATLSQFIIHRGLIISTLQAIFSSAFYFASVPLYQGFLMIGYATFYTMFPVFSIVLDKDVSPRLVLKFPELYKLMKGRSLSYKTFFIWVLISIYQGSVIMYGSILLFNDEFIHVVAITFTAVILTELLMLALTVRTWHWLMIVAELISFSTYLLTLILAPQFFDEKFIQSRAFLWKVTLMTLVSCLPLYILKFLHRKIKPPINDKLN